MKNLSLLLLLPLLIPSCRKPLFDHPPRDGRTPSDTSSTVRETAGEPPPAIPLPDVWQTAFSFPDTAVWRGGSSVPDRILIFKNGSLSHAYPAHAAHPDRHRFWDGHLWEDATNGYETIIYRDGEVFLRYDGEERLQGFLLLNGAVHSLGQHPGGGICYRIDGTEVFSDARGSALGWASDPEWPGGALTWDGGKVYYTYSIPIAEEGSEYHVMCGDTPVKKFPLLTSRNILDIRILGGVVYSLEKLQGDVIFRKDSQEASLGPLAAEKLRLVASDGRMMVKGYIKAGKGGRYWLRDESTLFYDQSFPQRMGIFLAGGGEKAWTALDGEDCVLQVWRDGTFVNLPPETYRLSLDRCALLKEGILALGLTADSGTGQCILIDGKEHPVQFNGFFTGTYIE